MKENVIIGKLIPAGTGKKRYRNIKLDSDINEDDELMFDEDVYKRQDQASRLLLKVRRALFLLCSLIREDMTLQTVSYTHLDVYKRQIY